MGRYGADTCRVWRVVKEVLEYLRANKHPLVKVMDNGLLYAVPKSRSEPITWMDSTIDGYPVVDRQGYIGGV